MYYNMHNPILIDENRLGMASENINFQVEFSKRICFFSSSSFLFGLIFGSSISLDPFFAPISKSKQITS